MKDRNADREIGLSIGWMSGCAFAVLVLAALLLLPPAVHARQDSARLIFEKTVGKTASKIHIVKKGESLLSIIRKMPCRKPGVLVLIKRMNPRLRNLDVIHPGQQILLPSYERSDIPEAAANVESLPDASLRRYTIQENDSLTGIIIAEFSDSADGRQLQSAETIEIYRQIRKLNPGIGDMNNLSVGSVLLLPGRTPQATLAGAGAGSATAAVGSPAKEEKSEADDAGKQISSRISPALYDLLTSIRPVIERMRGAVNASGNYYIPMLESSRITVDSSLIPSIELDDGTTVFLDYDNRLNDDVRTLIRQRWENYHFLGRVEMQSPIGALREVIGRSRGYSLARSEKYAWKAGRLEIAVFPDWLVSRNSKMAGEAYRQMIFLSAPDEAPLSEDVRLFLERGGGPIVTQIPASGWPVSRKGASADARRLLRDDLRGLEGVTFVERLLTALGEKVVRQSRIDVFKQETNGFNLSITADLLLQQGGRKLIINKKKLPDQFIAILRSSGFDFLAVGEHDTGMALAESALRAAGLSVSTGYYSSRIPVEGERVRVDVSFSALGSSNADGKILLVDFDMPVWLLPRTHGQATMIIRCQ